MEVDGGNLVIVISHIVENTLLKVIAGAIKSVFIFVVTEVAAAVLLVDGVEDMEELANAAHFVIGGEGMDFGESGFDEARLRAQISWKTDSTHAAAVFLKVIARSESIDWRRGGEVHIIIETEKLFREGWVVGQNADRIVVDFESVGNRFDDDTFFTVANHPVEFGGGKLVIKIKITKVHLGEESFNFGDGSTLTEDPGNEFELSDIILAVDMFIVDSVADEVEAGDAETLFVDGVVEEGVIFGLVAGTEIGWNFGDVSDADHGIMCILDTGFTVMKREVTGNNDSGFTIGEFVIEIATKIGVFGFVSSSCAHSLSFLFL